MKNNIIFLKDLGIISDVRERLGALDENDKSFDTDINSMSPKELVALWSGWNLGDESWSDEMIEFYEALEEEDKKIKGSDIIDRLESLSILDDIRKRVGAENEFDTSKDDIIESHSPKELVALWSGWNLGDEYWGEKIIDFYTSLKKSHENLDKIKENKSQKHLNK